MKWQHLIDPRRWYAFVYGKIVAFFLKMHVVEQVMYRSIICSECTNAGKCVECKCDVPDLYYTTNVACSRNRWGPMLDAENWKVFKKVYKIKFTIDDSN